MPDISAIHPAADRLAAYAQGRLDEPEMDEIEQHVCSCDSCCRTIRDQPEDTLIAKLRGRSDTTFAASTKAEASEVEPPVGFQVPSSFVVGPADSAAGHDQPTVAGPAADPPAPAGLPSELYDHPRYRVVAALGAGGMGTVYRAEHRLMDRPVALKIIRGDLLGNQAMVERFRREVKAAAHLTSHPNIVAAYDAEQAGKTHMLVMELIEGTDLARVVDRRGPLPVGEACEYARQVALGLQHAFEDGMVHRDIKPQNLMRTTRGQIKILDFGLARFASEVATHTGVTADGMILGSADFIAPEQIDDPHAAGIRADIYSLGCTLYFLLTGRPPFPDGSVIQKLLAHSEKTPRPLDEIRNDVPPDVARVVERMMAKDPARRFQTPDEVTLALAPFADAEAARVAAPGRDAPAGTGGRIAPVTLPALAPTGRGPKPSERATRPGLRQRRPWVRIVAALAILPVFATLLAQVTFFTLERGDRTVVKVQRELQAESPQPKPTAVTQWAPRAADAISPRTKAILATLDEPIHMDFAHETQLDDVLKYIKQASWKEKNPNASIPIYVDPLGLREANATLKSTVRMNVRGAPFKVTLPHLLGQLGLAYIVKDDVLIISSSNGIDRERNETAIPAADAVPRTKMVLAKLDESICMSFANATALDDVLKYIKQATTTATSEGITILVDPLGLKEPERSLTSTVCIDLDGVPLKATLKLVLKQLGLAYTVKDGLLLISSTERIRKPKLGAND